LGKAGELELPFDVVDDGSDVRAPMAGVVAGLRSARHEVCVVLPVDCPQVTPEVLRMFGDACRDAAVTGEGPLPGAWARSALPVLERRLREGRFALVHAYAELDVARVDVDPALIVDADTPEELANLL
jgi:molybdopterin-guanine dinucleotide biosynthesis protein A